MEPIVANDWPPDDFLAALGAVSLTWATSEDAIDSLCAIAFTKLGGKRAFPRHPEIPRSISRKIVYLKLCFGSLPQLAPWTAEAVPLLEETRKLSLERHEVLHGALAAWRQDGSVTLIRYRREDEWLATERQTTTTAELLSLRDRLFGLAVAWVRIAISVFRVEFSDDPDKSDGEVPS